MQKNLAQKTRQNKSDLIHRKRTLSRLMAVQILYQFEFYEHKTPLDEIKNNIIDNYSLTEEEFTQSYRDKIDTTMLQNLLGLIALDSDEIDQDISSFLKSEWTLTKISSVMLQILRLSAFELKFARDVPFKVIIDEYVDISSCFFEQSRTSFANSVIENLAKKYREEEFNSIKKKPAND